MGSLAQLFTDIAAKIKSKKGTTSPIIANNFPAEIDTLQYGSNLIIYRNDDPKEVGNFFQDMPNLTTSNLRTVNIISDITRIGIAAFRRNALLETINLSEKPVNTIASQAFYDCRVLLLSSLPSALTSLGAYAFSGCRKITVGVIPTGVTTIPVQAFQGCVALTQMTLGGAGKPITSIAADAFQGCTSLTNITVYTADGQPLANAPFGAVNATITYLDAFPEYGLEVDFENKTFTRLAGAVGKTAGIDFNNVNAFGGRRRCNVADNGTITAYYGEAGYTENGSNGQVMVYQPKFYYKVIPLKTEPISGGIGSHLRKAQYYVSDHPKTGYKLHPAFYSANGNAVDYILLSAFEGSIWDASASAYILDDAQVMDAAADKFCSIAGAKPASGLTQDLTRPKIEQIAQNRGTGWHGDTIKAESANQLLMMIEFGAMNTQTVITNGVVSITENASYNCSSLTGSTALLGNGTGAATETINEIGGVKTTYNTNGKRSITYRGVENPWGNIWKFVHGVNIYADSTTGEHQAYICSNFAFAENTKTDNYVGAGFTLSKTDGYISAMGYSETFDWLLMPSECTGASNLPVGDHYSQNTATTGYRITRFGGYWFSGSSAGGFYWALTSGVDSSFRYIGGRLIYVPV